MGAQDEHRGSKAHRAQIECGQSVGGQQRESGNHLCTGTPPAPRGEGGRGDGEASKGEEGVEGGMGLQVWVFKLGERMKRGRQTKARRPEARRPEARRPEARRPEASGSGQAEAHEARVRIGVELEVLGDGCGAQEYSRMWCVSRAKRRAPSAASSPRALSSCT